MPGVGKPAAAPLLRPVGNGPHAGPPQPARTGPPATPRLPQGHPGQWRPSRRRRRLRRTSCRTRRNQHAPPRRPRARTTGPAPRRSRRRTRSGPRRSRRRTPGPRVRCHLGTWVVASCVRGNTRRTLLSPASVTSSASRSRAARRHCASGGAGWTHHRPTPSGSAKLRTMTVRPIVITGEPVLHRRAQAVESFDGELRVLVADMFETMDAAHGVGLAAPQIGVGLRIFTWQMENNDGAPARGVVVNPYVSASKPAQEEPDPHEEIEGCLSVPGESFPPQARRAGQRERLRRGRQRDLLRGHRLVRPLHAARVRPPQRLPLRRPPRRQWGKKAKKAVKRNGRPAWTRLDAGGPRPVRARRARPARPQPDA